MTPEQMNEMVAVHVMGEPRPAYSNGDQVLSRQLAGGSNLSEGGCWDEVCRYEDGDVPTWVALPFTSDANTDLKVLRHVREHWSLEELDQVRMALLRLSFGRDARSAIWPALLYEPGDYSRAALIVLGHLQAPSIT